MKEYNEAVKKRVRKGAVIVIILSIILVLGMVLPYVYFAHYYTPRDGKPDRISEGIVPTAEDVANAVVYEHIVIFGVDGAGGYFGECDTPNFDRIFSEGSINYNGISEYPTVSAQNWGSMLFGVTPQKHKINNTCASTFPHLGIKYPSFFKIYSKINKDATFFSVVNWAPVNWGIVENGINGMTKKYAKKLIGNKLNEYEIDRKIAEMVAERTKKYSDTITFMQFDAVDHAGHGAGYGSDPFVEALQEIDKDMGIIYDAYKEKGWLKDTLFICVSDHGHTLTGGHDGEDETEKIAMLAVAGGKGNVIKGTSGKYVTHDLASIVLYALGVPQPDYYEGGVPKNLFTTLSKYN